MQKINRWLSSSLDIDVYITLKYKIHIIILNRYRLKLRKCMEEFLQLKCFFPFNMYSSLSTSASTSNCYTEYMGMYYTQSTGVWFYRCGCFLKCLSAKQTCRSGSCQLVCVSLACVEILTWWQDDNDMMPWSFADDWPYEILFMGIAWKRWLLL